MSFRVIRDFTCVDLHLLPTLFNLMRLGLCTRFKLLERSIKNDSWGRPSITRCGFIDQRGPMNGIFMIGIVMASMDLVG